MKRLRWLTVGAVVAIHEELISRYGGRPGIRTPESLDSALARPKNLAAYKPEANLPELAAAYAWGLLRNHPFFDGNKRIALASLVVFLELNGWELDCSEAEETAKVLQAAAGEIDETAWKAWGQKSARRTR